MFNIYSILSFLRKKFTKTDSLILFSVALAYFATRLIRLTSFPIFSDEGIYIRWAKVAWHDATWRFISLTDGKQPLQTWGTIPFLKLFPDNALLAGRLFSVFSGFGALIGIGVLLYYLFGKRTSYIGMFLYIFTPYFLFYDRLALVDSAVNAGSIWILFFSILLARTIRFDVALLFGLVTGLTLLAKSSARIFIVMSFFASLVIDTKNRTKLLNYLINFIVLFSLVALMGLVIYNIQRLSPFFHYVAEKNKTFVMTFDEFLKSPFSVVLHNLRYLPLYVLWEMGFTPGVIGLVGLGLLWKKEKRLSAYLFLWILLPYFVISFFTKVLFPRYLIFLGSALIVGASYCISQVKKKTALVFVIVLLIPLFFNYTVLFDHVNIPFPPVDRGQYIEAWPAGWGVKEIVDFAREKSKEKPVILMAEGNFGMAGDVLDVFLKRSDRITIRGYWPLGKKELEENQKELRQYYVYVVFSHRKEFPQEWPVTLLHTYQKPGGKEAIYLFELQK